MSISDIAFLEDLEKIVNDRLENTAEDSYTASLAAAGTKRIAQKVGEEGVELALAANIRRSRGDHRRGRRPRLPPDRVTGGQGLRASQTLRNGSSHDTQAIAHSPINQCRLDSIIRSRSRWLS